MWARLDGAFFSQQQGRRGSRGGLGGPQDASPSSPPPCPHVGLALSSSGVRPTLTPDTWEQGAAWGWTPKAPPTAGLWGVLPVRQHPVHGFPSDAILHLLLF